MFDTEIQEERKRKKQALQEQYKKTALERKKQQNKNAPKKERDWKEAYEKEKGKRKHLEKELKAHVNKEKKRRGQLEEQRMAWQKEKVKAQKNIAAYQQEKMKNQQLAERVTMLELTVNKLTEKYEKYTEKLEKQQEKKPKKELSHLMQVNKELMKTNQTLQQRNQQLKQQLKVNQTINRMEKNDRFQKENKILRENNRLLKERVESYQNIQQPEDLLKVLRDMITPTNLSHFYEDNQNKLEQLAKKVNTLHMTKKGKGKGKLRLHLLSQREKDENSFMGYISKQSNKWHFFPIETEDTKDYRVYEVIGNSTKRRMKQDMPVKAYLREDGCVMLLDVYEDHTLPEKMEQWLRPKEKNENKEKKFYPYFGEATVLLIGSRNMNEYKQRLEKHGLDVLTHNPFEESYHRIEKKCQKADVVVVCTSHVSHSVMDHVDRKDEKVELIERDNEEWVAARVRFSLMQQGLLHVSPEGKENAEPMETTEKSS